MDSWHVQVESLVYMDYCNFLFVFAPLSLELALERHLVSKVQSWALYLSRFSYIIEHITGVENFCAHIMTRWTQLYRNDCGQR